MKHPIKVFTILILVLTAVTAAVIMTMRYMDVLQRQFDFLRSLLARRESEASGDLNEEFSDESENETESYPEEPYSNDNLTF